MFALCVSVVPAILWVSTAATRRGRWIGLVVLTSLAAAQVAVARRWVFPEGTATLLFVLTGLVIGVLLLGPWLETDPNLPRTASWRWRICYVVSVVLCLVTATVAVLLAAAFAMFGAWAWVPAEDALEPLPEGVVVRESANLGCTPRSSNSDCTRRFVIDQPGASADDISGRLRQVLSETRACAFEHRTRREIDYWWGTCPVSGWPLDRHETAVSITTTGPTAVTLDLSYLDDW